MKELFEKKIFIRHKHVNESYICYWNLFHLSSENNTGDETTIEGRTFILYCNGAEGDMVYLTDLDTGNVGHNIAEVKIYRIYIGMYII